MNPDRANGNNYAPLTGGEWIALISAILLFVST